MRNIFFYLLLGFFFIPHGHLWATSAKLNISYGLTFFYKKQYLKAFEEFKKAIAKEPNNAQAHYNIGRVYKVKRQYNLAQKHFEYALRLDPSLVVVKRALLSLRKLTRQNIENRLKIKKEVEFDNAVTTFSDSKNYLALGRKAFKKGDERTALRFLLKAFAQDKRNSEIAGTIGYLFRRLNNLEQARAYYAKSVALGTRNPENFYSLALIFRDLKQYPEAIDNLNRAITMDSLVLRYHLSLADIYEKTGKFDESFNAFHRILKLNPGNKLAQSRIDSLKKKLGGYFLARGEYFFSNSSWGKAAENLNKALQYGVYKGAKKRAVTEKLQIANYWHDKAVTIKKEKRKEEKRTDNAYVTYDFTLEEVVENPKRYAGKYVRWEGWVQYIDLSAKKLYLSVDKRVESGLVNFFQVTYKGVLPTNDRRIARFAFVKVIGKIVNSDFLIDPNTNDTSEKVQPVVRASELTFVHPDVSGELKVTLY
ncbi:tetratricopeptide repeat protein [Candidatus Riflebacteria bacterium]